MVVCLQMKQLYIRIQSFTLFKNLMDGLLRRKRKLENYSGSSEGGAMSRLYSNRYMLLLVRNPDDELSYFQHYNFEILHSWNKFR